MLLNLGCGGRQRDDCVNIDINPHCSPDEVLNLLKFPWKWGDNSIEGIYMFHFLEHCVDPIKILSEAHRVLRLGGFLHITTPHSSSVIGRGCLGHYRTFSYNTLKDYLSRNEYLFGKQMFKTVKQRIVWQPHFEWFPIQWLIDLSPRLFERVWAYYVGGATEVMWRGLKI